MNGTLAELAKYLLSCRVREDFKPMSIPALLKQVYILDVERGPNAHGTKFRIKLTGTGLDSIFGRAVSGRYLDEFIHGPRGAEVLAAYQQCAQDRAPCWMRQLVNIGNSPTRYVEGIMVYLDPQLIYGGLVAGKLSISSDSHFEKLPLHEALRLADLPDRGDL